MKRQDLLLEATQPELRCFLVREELNFYGSPYHGIYDTEVNEGSSSYDFEAVSDGANDSTGYV